MDDARVGDQNVEAAMTCNDGIDGGLRGMMVSHVEGRDFDFQSTTAQSTRAHFERINVAAVKYHDCANFCEPFGHCQTKSARRTGNERRDVIQAPKPEPRIMAGSATKGNGPSLCL